MKAEHDAIKKSVKAEHDAMKKSVKAEHAARVKAASLKNTKKHFPFLYEGKFLDATRLAEEVLRVGAKQAENENANVAAAQNTAVHIQKRTNLIVTALDKKKNRVSDQLIFLQKRQQDDLIQKETTRMKRRNYQRNKPKRQIKPLKCSIQKRKHDIKWHRQSRAKISIFNNPIQVAIISEENNKEIIHSKSKR